MPTSSQDAPRSLTDRPNLRHLKDQAKDLFRAGSAASLTEAQFKIARLYGFASWPRLKAHVDSLEVIGQLKQAIDTNDSARIKTLMTHNPALHCAPLGYNKNGPLTWVAECRVPWEPPSAQRLAIAKWMLENGSDVHQGGDGPLMRAALFGHRIPMMELLLAHGADVNAEWNGYFPIIFAPCETVEPAPIKWLLEHGANPNCDKPGRKYPGTALDYVIGTYGRSSQLGACMEILLKAGGVTKYDVPPVLDLLRGRLDLLAERLDADPALLNRQFPELEFGATGARRLTLRAATLLHVAAEYGNVEAAKLLLDCGADVNARATVDESGVGGQTPIFHAVTQYGDWELPVAQLLMERGADLSVRAKLPGHYERPGEVVECTPLGYALRFPGGENKTVTMLRERGAAE
ncbi:MAG TPA: ankyrin repeat domain-containing protein [Candidatus Polarisedimenticolia bacterium]|nr:ankyrin repeat domain-containing protein [Candidatus Polarisedimenticolia bacterium]